MVNAHSSLGRDLAQTAVFSHNSKKSQWWTKDTQRRVQSISACSSEPTRDHCSAIPASPPRCVPAISYWDTSGCSLWLEAPGDRCCAADHFQGCERARELCVRPVLHKYLLWGDDLYCWYLDCMGKAKRRKEENKTHQCCFENQEVPITLPRRAEEARRQ